MTPANLSNLLIFVRDIEVKRGDRPNKSHYYRNKDKNMSNKIGN